MRKLTLLFLLFTTIVFSQATNIKDLGAVESINDSCGFDNSAIINRILNRKEVAYIPHGNWCVKNPIYLNWDRSAIIGQSKEGSRIFTDKAIDIIRIQNRAENQAVKGVTLSHVGDSIYGTEIAAIHLSTWNIPVLGIIYAEFDFNYEGVKTKFESRINDWSSIYNDDFGKYWNDNYDYSLNEAHDNHENYTDSYTGYGAHVFWFEGKNTARTDYFSESTIKGIWKNFNTGLKITKKKQSSWVSILDINVLYDRFKTIAFIEIIGASNITMRGQARYSLDWNPPLGTLQHNEEKLIPLFYVKGNGNNIYIKPADRAGGSGKWLKGGLIKGTNNTFKGFRGVDEYIDAKKIER